MNPLLSKILARMLFPVCCFHLPSLLLVIKSVLLLVIDNFFLPFSTVIYCITTSAILSHSLLWRPTHLPSYQSLFNETMKESATLFRIWLHYHTSTNVLTNPRRGKHSFSSSLKINKRQQNAKSKSKVTHSLISSVSKAKPRESILFIYFLS